MALTLRLNEQEEKALTEIKGALETGSYSGTIKLLINSWKRKDETLNKYLDYCDKQQIRIDRLEQVILNRRNSEFEFLKMSNKIEEREELTKPEFFKDSIPF